MKDKQHQEQNYINHKIRYSADMDSSKIHNSLLLTSKNNTINKLSSNIDKLLNEKNINANRLQDLSNTRSDLISRVHLLTTELNSVDNDLNM